MSTNHESSYLVCDELVFSKAPPTLEEAAMLESREQETSLPEPWRTVVAKGWLDCFTIPCRSCTTKYLGENPAAVLRPEAPIWPRFRDMPKLEGDLGIFGCDHHGGEDCGNGTICFSTLSTVEALIAAWNQTQLGPLIPHYALYTDVLCTWSTMARHLLRDAQELDLARVETYRKEIQSVSTQYRYAENPLLLLTATGARTGRISSEHENSANRPSSVEGE